MLYRWSQTFSAKKNMLAELFVGHKVPLSLAGVPTNRLDE